MNANLDCELQDLSHLDGTLKTEEDSKPQFLAVASSDDQFE
jgi:hypothetical protein